MNPVTPYVPSGYILDNRYSDAIVDIQGSGSPMDFCRALRKKTDSESLHISCDLGGVREGMNPLEYNTRTVGEGFQFSRDDYWRQRPHRRTDYCRILKDSSNGDWYASCAIAGHDGFKKGEERDTSPPDQIQKLINSYDGVLVWFRWHDDRDDYAHNANFSIHGTPEFSELLRAGVSRGLQLNRNVDHPPTDYIRWGESGTLELNQVISPRQIRAISMWIWWDGFEKGATLFECKNGTQDKIVLGVDGGGIDLQGSVLPVATVAKAAELPAAIIQSIGQLTEPNIVTHSGSGVQGATYFFEIWDGAQRIMRLNTPMGSAKMGTWQHLVVTTTDATAWWPTWQMWINGSLISERKDGRLSPAMEIRENTIGRNVRGCIKDVRVYNTPLFSSKCKDIIEWSKPRLHPSP